MPGEALTRLNLSRQHKSIHVAQSLPSFIATTEVRYRVFLTLNMTKHERVLRFYIKGEVWSSGYEGGRCMIDRSWRTQCWEGEHITAL